MREFNMDSPAVFAAAGGLVAAAVVDRIGNDGDGAFVMRLVVETAVRVGATKGALAGVLAAATLVEDPGVEDFSPDGVVVLALAEPGRPTLLGWTGRFPRVRLGQHDPAPSHRPAHHGRLPRAERRRRPGAVARQLGTGQPVQRHRDDRGAVRGSGGGVAAAGLRWPRRQSRSLTWKPWSSATSTTCRLWSMRSWPPSSDEQGYRDDATAVALLPAWENDSVADGGIARS